MSFMQPEATKKKYWWIVEKSGETSVFPADYFTKQEAEKETFGKGEPETKKKKAYGIRWSAPGYLDCTDWELYTNKREAKRRIREMEQEQKDREIL